MNPVERIYHQWHEFASSRNVDALIDLYDDHAILESPLVPIIMGCCSSGVLTGRDEILAFLIEGTKRRPNEFVKWYRTGTYHVNNNILIWEYPRETPTGDQVDILELMEIKHDKILKHRIYWGWFGVNLLLNNQASKLQEQYQTSNAVVSAIDDICNSVLR